MSQAQVKNSYNSIGEVEANISTSDLVLKVSLTNNSLRYFVFAKTHNQIIFFGEYTLHHVKDKVDLDQRIEKLFSKDDILQLSYSKVLIGFDEKYSLVPNEFSFLIDRDKQITQQLEGTAIVFEVQEELIHTLKKIFPSANFAHLNSTYSNLLPKYLGHSTEKLFVNVSQTYFDVIYFDNTDKLRLMNRYDYQTATDFIYFILFCTDELKIDRETIELTLLGEVDIQSKIYDLCYRYFRNIDFVQKPENINFTKAFDTFPKHLHFHLYNLTA